MSQKIDLSGIHHFWEIVGIFENGNEPEDEKWKELFKTPGYRILNQIEFSEEYFKQTFNSAYGSSDLSDDIDEQKKTIVRHFRHIKDNREELNDFLGEIFNKDFYDDALDLAFEWLPLDEQEPYPPVSFLFFQKDARGYIPIVFDLQFAYELGDDLTKFLAHEMHHFYRNMQVSFDPDIDDKELIWALNQIHMEGMADQINKELIFDEHHVFGEDYQEMYIDNYRNAEQYIEELDNHIRKYSDIQKEYGEKVQESLPLSGHPIGFFMSESIIDSGLRDELIEGYDDPFYFFKLYNKAADKEGLTKYSEKTIQVIEELKELYG